MAADRPALWRNPESAVQPRAGGGHALARAVHLLHAPGRALPDVFRPGARGHRGACAGQRCADPVRRQRPRGGGGRARAARGLLQGLRHLGGRSRRRGAVPDLRPLHALPSWGCLQRALRGVGRGAAAVLLDLLGGRQAPARHGRGEQPVSGLDRHLRRRGLRRGRAQGDRDRRSDGAGGEPHHPAIRCSGRSCAPPSWNGCSGTAPGVWSAGRSDWISGRRQSAAGCRSPEPRSYNSHFLDTIV